jgi:hypothetical protein
MNTRVVSLVTGVLLMIVGGYLLLYVYAFSSMVNPALQGWERQKLIVSKMWDFHNAGLLTLLSLVFVAYGGWLLGSLVANTIRSVAKPSRANDERQGLTS